MKVKDFITRVYLLMIPILWSIHHIRDAFEPYSVDLFLFCDKKQDIQWYFKDMGVYISIVIILYLIWSNLKSKHEKSLAGILCIFSIIDILGYWLFYMQYTYIVMSLALICWAINIFITMKQE